MRHYQPTGEEIAELQQHDRRTIFGDTYDGVPSPLVPIVHPYPTRYHGPTFTEPRFGLPYTANPMSVAPAEPRQLGTPRATGEIPSPFAKSDTARTVYLVLSTASMAASAYHGYKRNNSVGWAIGWAILGALFPVITPTIAVAQGFGKPKAGA